MSLRVKIELVLIAMIGLLVVLGYWFQREVVLPGLMPLENQEAQEQAARCIQGFRDYVSLVSAQCRKWTQEIDINDPALVEHDSEKENETLRESLVKRELNLAAAIDTQGKLLSSTAIDLESAQPINLPELSMPVWPEDHPLLSNKPESEPVAGMVLTTQGPVLAASWPVTETLRPGEDEGDPLVKGCLIVGRLLDREILNRVQSSAGVPFDVWALNRAIPHDARKHLYQLVDPFSMHLVDEPGGQWLHVYASYPDLQGRPALLLRRRVARGVYSEALRAVQWGLLAQLVIGLGALLVMILILRKMLITPLGKLITHAVQIGATQDLSTRLNLSRRDEIGILGREFDTMVGRLEKDQQERQQAEEALRESEERFALAVEGANDGVWDWNLKTNGLYVSSRWKSMLGYSDEDISTTPDDWFNLVHPEDIEGLKASLDAHLKGQTDYFVSENRTRHKDGVYLWMLCRGVAVRDDDGELARMAGSQTDITERKNIEQQLAHDAFHDNLTQLPNRALFLDRLGQAIKHSQRYEQYQFAVLFLDLDRFKVVNDSLGHVVGDELLKEVSKKLETCLRDGNSSDRMNDTIARFGGDEFVILLSDIGEVTDAVRVAERIQRMFKTPFFVGDTEVFTSASVGIALSAEGYDEPEEFLRNADTAMYRAKAHGKAQHEIFNSAMHSQAMERLEIETNLRNAVKQGRFTVYYQPIVDLYTGRISAFEALIRWRHPDKGMISPSVFIPVAEETGLILPIGQWVLEEACRQTKFWHDQIPSAAQLLISVNLSVKQFQQPNLVAAVEHALLESELEPRFLKLEITESAVMENVDQVNNTLIDLRSREIMLSVDDFGTGYSSLSYLHRFPMNTLKIDQSFVKDLHITLENWQIVKTILMLAKNLKMEVIAEGVETREQYEQLKEFGAEFGQGYYMSKPLPADEATELLKQNPQW